MERTSIYKGYLVAVILLLLLIIFCLFNVKAGTAPYYLSLFSLIADVPFFIYLIYKIRKESKEISDK